MAKNVLIPVVLLPILLLFSSCRAAVPYFDVVRGNYTYQQGKFAESTLHYLSALDTGLFREWVSYNLGNVYHALGETEAALEIWDRCAAAPDREIQFRVNYNRGTMFYEMGRFRDSYDSFRRALELKPNEIDAKFNLELSLQKIQALSGSTGSTSSRDEGKVQEEKSESKRILEYVGRKEGERWTSTEKTAENPNRRDW